MVTRGEGCCRRLLGAPLQPPCSEASIDAAQQPHGVAATITIESFHRQQRLSNPQAGSPSRHANQCTSPLPRLPSITDLSGGQNHSPPFSHSNQPPHMTVTRGEGWCRRLIGAPLQPSCSEASIDATQQPHIVAATITRPSIFGIGPTATVANTSGYNDRVHGTRVFGGLLFLCGDAMGLWSYYWGC
jgi:hypothetical protein